jgi:hypothetical protein
MTLVLTDPGGGRPRGSGLVSPGRSATLDPMRNHLGLARLLLLVTAAGNLLACAVSPSEHAWRYVALFTAVVLCSTVRLLRMESKALANLGR